MTIDMKGIENMLVTSTINDYGVEGKKHTHTHTNSKRHVSIPLKAHFTLKFIFIR
jgi:hypothetical protein